MVDKYDATNEGIKTTALNMLKVGASIEFIQQVTGLSVQEIESLIRKE